MSKVKDPVLTLKTQEVGPKTPKDWLVTECGIQRPSNRCVNIIGLLFKHIGAVVLIELDSSPGDHRLYKELDEIRNQGLLYICGDSPVLHVFMPDDVIRYDL